MEVISRSGGRTTTDLHMSKKWKDKDNTSPERTRVWTEPTNKHKLDRKVPVVYYISRNGQLEHPHFIEVPLSASSDGLYLRDVIDRLNSLRGKGMAGLYSWSSKRSYKNGFVWHDLAENDFIYPAHGQEYVLKGSELLEGSAFVTKSDETVSFSSKKLSPESQKPGEDLEFPLVSRRRRNQSWSAIDLHEYKVYKTDSTGESVGRVAANAATQTDDKRRRRRSIIKEVEEEEDNTGLSREEIEIEISPPPSDSSPETLETLMKADGRLILRTESDDASDNQTASNHHHPSARAKASTVLMQLISCGSMSFRDCGPGADHPGLSLISHYKARLPRGGEGCDRAVKGAGEATVENITFLGRNNRVKQLEDKEYFSGSLIETKKVELIPALKRSSSYNADRSSRMEEMEKDEIDGVRAKCIPRKPKTHQSTRKDGNKDVSGSSNNAS